MSQAAPKPVPAHKLAHLYSSSESLAQKQEKSGTNNRGTSMHGAFSARAQNGRNLLFKAADLLRNSARGPTIVGRRSQRFHSEGPGPGQYAIPEMKSTAKYSFGLRNELKLRTQGPAPNSYSPQKPYNPTAITFQHSKRPSLELSRLNPGPGEYDASRPAQTKYKFTFPKREKFYEEIAQLKEKKKIPGPGKYELKKSMQNSVVIKFGMTKRDFQLKVVERPGPGDYSPTSSTHRQSPTAVIGTQKREVFPANSNPGPSQYTINEVHSARNRHNPQILFPKASRQGTSQRVQTLAGPGSYQIANTQRGHSYSMARRNSIDRLQRVPGPLEYSPRYGTQFRRTEMAVIPKQKKFVEVKTTKPGPGQYHVRDDKVKTKSFYFPKSVSKPSRTECPGPGAYNV